MKKSETNGLPQGSHLDPMLLHFDFVPTGLSQGVYIAPMLFILLKVKLFCCSDRKFVFKYIILTKTKSITQLFTLYNFSFKKPKFFYIQNFINALINIYCLKLNKREMVI